MPTILENQFQSQQHEKVHYNSTAGLLAVGGLMLASQIYQHKKSQDEEENSLVHSRSPLSPLVATAHAEESKDISILPPPPSLYEYALLSNAAYFDEPPVKNEDKEIWQKLHQKGWKRIENINDASGYCGSVWINDASKQIVIAHRGSENIASWFTDIESVILLKPGSFVRQAITLMQHAKVRDARLHGSSIYNGAFLGRIFSANLRVLGTTFRV